MLCPRQKYLKYENVQRAINRKVLYKRELKIVGTSFILN
jgi:hypothetical protein